MRRTGGLGAVVARRTSAVDAKVAGAVGVVATRKVLVWQIWQCVSSWAGGHFAPPGASTCATVGAWSPGSKAGHTMSAQTWTNSTMTLPARRMDDRWENTGRV